MLYFFDTANGDSNTDEHGVKLSSDDEAIWEAVRFAGSMLHHQPDILAARHKFVVMVRPEGAEPLATIRVELIKP